MPTFKIGEIYVAPNGSEITISNIKNNNVSYSRLLTDGSIYKGSFPIDKVEKKISKGSWVLKGSSTVPVKIAKSTPKTTKTKTVQQAATQAVTQAALQRYFEKDDYIVTIANKLKGRADNSYPDNYIFKQLERKDYLFTYLDARGRASNSFDIFKADKTGGGEWRYATKEEAEAYEKAGKPISVDDVSKYVNVATAKPKSVKKLYEKEIVEDLKDMNIQAWDDIGITSGSKLYQNDDFQKKYNDLMVAAIQAYTKYDLSKLSEEGWESISKILEDDNFNSLSNFLGLKGYLGQKDKDIWIELHSKYSASCLNPDIFIDKAAVATKQEIIEEAPIQKMSNSNEEAQIEILKRDISQLLFIRSLASPIEFERKMKISQIIQEKKKEIDRLTFYITERKIGSKDIFDDLFEQSFTPIQHSYSGVYGNPDVTEFFTPDGNPSQLSDELNSIIRTKEFKEWFGDWELAYLYRDTEIVDCSKVLTENFEPRLVWHGTGREFSSFRFDSFPAAYFAVSKAYSDWFAYAQGGDDGFTIPFFLDIRTPLNLTHFGTNKIKPKQFFDYMYLKTGLDMDSLEVNEMFLDPTFPAVETWVYLRNNPKMIVKISESKIYDGINFYETNPGIKEGDAAYRTEAYIIFRAEQCKIAAPNRGMLLLASLKSFLLKRGGQI
jgi:hypothetical protein